MAQDNYFINCWKCEVKTVQCKPHISKSGDFENVVNKFESIGLVGKFSYLFHLILMEETMTKSENS